MNKIVAVHSKNAPEPVGLYPHARRVGAARGVGAAGRRTLGDRGGARARDDGE